MNHTSLRGFTLIEMSIVLVIIGIITGGIFLGRSLIVNARLQTVMTDMDNYVSATNNFKQAYQGLPGDISNADILFGPDSNGCPAGMYSSVGHSGSGGGATGTCNGNGHGQLIAASAASNPGEIFLFWQHLYYAKMFTQSLSNRAGTSGTGYYDSIIGTNVPAGSIRGSGFSAIWFGTPGVSSTDYCTTSNCFAGSYGNVLLFGGHSTGNPTWAPILTPDQAASIDSKIDDGFPATGKVRAMISSSTVNPNCTTGTTAPGAYNVSNNTSGSLCSLIFVMGY